MPDDQELRLVLRTVADTNGARQTQEALRATARQTEAANEALRRAFTAGPQTAPRFQDVSRLVTQQLGTAPTLRPGDLGVASAGGGAGATRELVTAREELRRQRAEQQRAERDARLEGRQFSRISTGEVVQPIKDAADHAERLHGGFRLTSSEAFRFGTSLVGIGAGLSVAAGAARGIHDAIAGAVQAQRELDQATRVVTATLGQQAPAATAAARALASDPTTRGTTAQFGQSIAGLQVLRQEAGLSQEQILGLAHASGQLARIHGVELPVATKAVEAAVRGNTGALEDFNISLVDSQGRIRGVNASFAELAAASGHARAEQVLLAAVQDEIRRQNLNTASSTDDLASAFDRLGKAAQLARERAGEPLRGPAAGIVGGAARVLGGEPLPTDQVVIQAVLRAFPALAAFQSATVQGQRDIARFTPAPPPPRFEGLGQARREDREVQEEQTRAARQAAFEIRQQAQAYETLQIQITRTVGSLQHLQQQQAQLGTIGGALRGPDFPFVAQPQLEGQARAGQDVLAEVNRRVAAGQAARIRASIVSRIGQPIDPTNPAAGSFTTEDVASFDRRAAAGSARAQAQQAGGLAQRAQAEAQARITALGLIQQQRALQVAQPLANLRTETLNREGAILNLQRQEADLGDRITITQRSNLELTRQQLAARAAALPAAEALNDNLREQQQLELDIEATRQDVRRGVLPVEALQDIPGMRQRLLQLAREEPRAGAEALRAQRPGELLERQAEREQIGREQVLSVLEEERRTLEDQLTPIRAAQRLTDERTATIRRNLELEQLSDTARQVAAQQQLITANALSLAAEEQIRQADRWAASIAAGVTDLQLAAEQIRNFPTIPVIRGPSSGDLVAPDRQRAGAGAGAGSVTNNITINVTSPATADEIAQQVLRAMNDAATRTPLAPPVSLAGAIG